MTHREDEMFEHLARGRALRSRAFVDALKWVARTVKSTFAATPQATAPKGARTC